MKDIITRSLSGIVFITIVIGSILLGIKAFVPISFLFILIGLFEYNRFFKSDKSIVFNIFPFLLIGSLFYYLQISEVLGKYDLSDISYMILFLFFVFELWNQSKDVLKSASVKILGQMYIIIPFVLMVKILVNDDLGVHSLLMLFVLVWANDSFAYLSGRFFGKTKLFERISPKKTWEGTIGGAVMTMLFSIVFFNIWNDHNLLFYIVSAFLISSTSILGDLFESLIKRTVGVKDSGNIMPGHGGILDRFDAVLYSTPFFYSWCLIYMYIC